LPLLETTTMPRSKRLSSGKALLDESSSDEDEATKPVPKSRGRKSLGKGAQVLSTAAVAESAEEVAEMYRTVIKMASENKINMKNAWSLSLIDHMRDVVNDEEEEEKEEDVPKEERRGSVNFQRASCTLDAGVKIYCSRVDDTWATSYRVLESLQRNREKDKDGQEAEPEDDEEGPESVEDEAPKKPRKAARQAVATLASSTSLIDATAEDIIEDDGDAFFSRLSKGFDGGNARSMLLQRLKCVGGVVSFGYTDAPHDADASTTTPPQEAPYGGLETLKSMLPAELVAPATLCPPLVQLRREHDAIVEGGAPLAAFDDVSEANSVQAPYDDDDDDDDEGFGGGGFGDNEDFEDSPSGGATFPEISAPLFDDPAAVMPNDENAAPQRGGLVVSTKRTDDLAYFEPAMLEHANNWAGITHWKRTGGFLKKASTTKRKSTADAKTTKPKKAPAQLLDFSAPPLDEDVTAPPKTMARSKRDSTMQSEASRQRDMKDAHKKLVLPTDVRVTLAHLRTLFLVKKTVTAATTRGGGSSEDEQFEASSSAHFDAEAGGYFDDGGDDDDDAAFGGYDANRFELPPDDRADSFESADDGPPKLLACDRVVENVNISFATHAKRVDVRHLKTSMWRDIEARKTDGFSFADVVQSVADSKRQSDVTMPFYFICLLHLCNEKTLALTPNGSSDISDFGIQQEA